MPIELKRDPRPIKVDLGPALAAAAAVAIGHVRARTRSGVDIDGEQFAGYSGSYILKLTKMGEAAQVDLLLTGGLLNGVKVLSKTATSVTIGPGTGTSPQVAPPKQRVSKKTGKPLKARAAATKTGKRSPPHSLLGLWLHRGTPHMQARRWLGLSAQGKRDVVAAIQRVGVLKKG